MQLELFPPPEIPLEELFQAYEDCRKNKRGTMNASAFEVDYESKLIRLWEDITGGTFDMGSIYGDDDEEPVQREIFAAAFRDRVVHHLIINKINHLFQKEFIYDSYACRAGKGTHHGIRRLDGFIRRCSANYTRDAYILKLDIRGFFMSIDRRLLFSRLSSFLKEKYLEQDSTILLELCRKTIFHDPPRHCIIRGSKDDWKGLPPDKSLFHSAPGCGLPIGNLTSQVFANFYLNLLDHFVKHRLGVRYYGRYVDDMVCVHGNMEYLKHLVSEIRRFLSDDLKITLHDRKIYLQHYERGVKFLGVIIKPHRKYIAHRTKGNFHQVMIRQNVLAEDHKPGKEERNRFLSVMNSYLGIMRHYDTYRLRRKMLLKTLSPRWQGKIVVKQDCLKVKLLTNGFQVARR